MDHLLECDAAVALDISDAELSWSDAAASPRGMESILEGDCSESELDIESMGELEMPCASGTCAFDEGARLEI